jgi:hypothetical protein
VYRSAQSIFGWIVNRFAKKETTMSDYGGTRITILSAMIVDQIMKTTCDVAQDAGLEDRVMLNAVLERLFYKINTEPAPKPDPEPQPEVWPGWG